MNFETFIEFFTSKGGDCADKTATTSLYNIKQQALFPSEYGQRNLAWRLRVNMGIVLAGF